MDYSIENLKKALDDVNMLSSATAIKGTNFGETYKEMLDVSRECIQSRLKELEGNS